MLNRFWRRIVLVVAVVAAVVPFARAQAPDPANGTWELNVAKSKYASTAPRSETRTLEVVGTRFTFTAKGISAAGTPYQWQYVANLDGTEAPTPGNPAVDTISLTQIDRLTVDSVQKKAGKVVFRNRRVVSADGKTMTVTSEATNDKGETATSVMVFDKK